MTPRVDVEWIDIDDDRDESLRTIRECRHGQLLIGKGSIDEPLGMILKRDLLDQVLDGQRSIRWLSFASPSWFTRRCGFSRFWSSSRRRRSAWQRSSTNTEAWKVLSLRLTCSRRSRAI